MIVVYWLIWQIVDLFQFSDEHNRSRGPRNDAFVWFTDHENNENNDKQAVDKQGVNDDYDSNDDYDYDSPDW